MTEAHQGTLPEADHARVAPTAWGVAYFRTLSDIPLTTELFHGLEEVVGGPGGVDFAEKASRSRLAPQLEARYKLVDHLLKQSGINQVIELAAGAAPRGVNHANADAAFDYVELDLPEVAQIKKRILSVAGVEVPPNLRIVEGDALNGEDVTNAIARFSKDKPVAVINEGLMRYLSFKEKTMLAENVRAILQEFGGVWITPDITLKQAMESEDREAKGHTNKLKETTGIDIEQNVFRDVAHAKGFFENLGFSIEEYSFLEMTDQLASPGKLGMSVEDVNRLNKPCSAFVMRLV